MERPLRVGRFEISVDQACNWVSEYTNAAANANAARPYAYPAYDLYGGGTDESDVLTDGDLLAPVLLNVSISIRGFYGLQRIRDHLQAALSAPDLAHPLTEIDEEDVPRLIGPLYAVLDEPSLKPWSVGATKLSKVLHRKRPQSVVLHDTWTRRCYLDTPRVPRSKNRSWADYMSAVSAGIRDDLLRQDAEFQVVRDASAANPTLSDIRLIDILAWNAGKSSQPKVGA